MCNVESRELDRLVEELPTVGWATDRLRILIDALTYSLGVDCVSAFLCHRLSLFSQAFSDSPSPGRNRQYWPIYYSGIYDDGAVYGLPSRARVDELLAIPSLVVQLAHSHDPAFRLFPASPTHRFVSFARREAIATVYKLNCPSDNDPQLILFLMRRVQQHDKLDENVIGSATEALDKEFWAGIQRQTDRFPSLARPILQELEHEKNRVESEQSSPARRARNYGQIADHFRERISALVNGKTNSSSSTYILDQVGSELISHAIRLLRDPDLMAVFFIVAEEVKTGAETTQYYSTSREVYYDGELDPRLVLLPRCTNGLWQPSLRHRVVIPYRFSRVVPTIRLASEFFHQHELGAPPQWSPQGFYDYKMNPVPVPTGHEPPGLVTVASHLGYPLFMGDMVRRYSIWAPLYGLSFISEEDKPGFAMSLPLVREVGRRNDGDTPASGQRNPSRCWAALAIGGARPLTPRRSDVSFMAELCHEAIGLIPEDELNKRVLLD